MFYKVKWQLISWPAAWREEIVELSDREVELMGLHFASEGQAHRLMSYKITPIKWKGPAEIYAAYQGDLKAEQELAEVDNEDGKPEETKEGGRPGNP